MSHPPTRPASPTPKNSAINSQEHDHLTAPPARNTNTRPRFQPGDRSTRQQAPQLGDTTTRLQPGDVTKCPKPGSTWLRPSLLQAPPPDPS